MRAAVLACAALLLAGLVAGCGGDSAQTQATARAKAAHARLMHLGAHVFAEHCSTCHPLLGRPNADLHTDAPALDLDEVEPTRAYVEARVAGGGVGMGGFGSELGDGERRAVIAYVHEVSGRDVDAPANPDSPALAQGRTVYSEHCARCHSLDGSKPTRPNPIWLATDFEDVRPSVAYVEQKVREGQSEAMPSFRGRLSPAEIRAVARYLNAAAR